MKTGKLIKVVAVAEDAVHYVEVNTPSLNKLSDLQPCSEMKSATSDLLLEKDDILSATFEGDVIIDAIDLQNDHLPCKISKAFHSFYCRVLHADDDEFIVLEQEIIFAYEAQEITKSELLKLMQKVAIRCSWYKSDWLMALMKK